MLTFIRVSISTHSVTHTLTHPCTRQCFLLKADKPFVLNFVFFFFHADIQGGNSLQIHVPLLLADIHMNLNVMFFSECLVFCLHILALCIYLQILNKAIWLFLFSSPSFHSSLFCFCCLSPVPLFFLHNVLFFSEFLFFFDMGKLFVSNPTPPPFSFQHSLHLFIFSVAF